MRPRLLDLFSCAGGAAMGYHRAGFDVVGVDINPQPRYPFEHHVGDAIEFVTAHGHEFDAIHASPPCQAYTNAQKIRGNTHPDLVAPTRKALEATGRPWVIENVPGSPLESPAVLCGAMFGLRTYRHRWFESNWPLMPPFEEPHAAPVAKMGRTPRDGEFMHVVGHFAGVAAAREAMGIDWMTRDELAQSIPPAYTEFIGSQLLDHLTLATTGSQS